MFDSLVDELLLPDELIPLFANDPIIASLNTELDKLTIDDHTHELQIKIERIKRQKTVTKLCRLKKTFSIRII